ncbi:bifunctional riboflavin kinase/FAD synthetase [Ectothiorhodospiraceae bacterium BW-2]|nr:bifunctional riboflavin kinase/FAD synthetase [Ectothiorhodospiraceae bacterium BW-2]
MELIRGLHNLRPRHHGCVATIGNFDGVHLGHQAVLGHLAAQGARLNLPTTVMTFEPQPAEYFQRPQLPPRLTRLREKIGALRHLSVDRIVVVKFNPTFAAMRADRFIEQLLIRALGVKFLVVGDDFRFGADRSGDFQLLTEAGERAGFQVVTTQTFALGEARVSSTRIRQALAADDFATATELLGRPYRMSGRVAHGAQKGRTIGFPTANILLHRKASPLHGVFAVKLYGIGAEPLQGIANLGNRPTVDGHNTLLEVHLFDFNRDIYGCYVDVDFLHKIRNEQKFASFEALKSQIEADAAAARQWHQQQAATP